jgi:predicted ATPase/DNA-binding CsgD family transcriptional regulator
VSTPPPGPLAISAREAEVLAGVRNHLTNAEIADRLVISVRTVETHVASLLRKVGVDNRRALARAADGVSDGTVPGRTTAPEAPVRGRLPQPLTRFIGRAAERAELAAAVRTHRLVTAVGPGGVGKTRLAIAVAGDVAASFGDGVGYVDLVPVTTGDMVALTVAQALGVPRWARTAEDGLVDWLSGRRTLLVLDNCEHLADAVAELVERLLAGGDQLVILATSRSRLLLPFERAVVVPGLSLPADGAAGDAVTLFSERAGAAGSPAMPRDMERVEEICVQLDGIALAIELAAARLPALGLAGLRAGLCDGLGLLTGRRRDVRHQSLRAALDWSYQLLEPADQALLRRISVFADPFTSTTASEVVAWSPVDAATVAGGLARLADQSLIMPAVDGADRRYRALETVRQYGAEQLREHSEADETAVRHLRWCLAPAGDAKPSLADLRAAMSWAGQRPDHRAAAYLLADRLGAITFELGIPQESQHRYEQAASLAHSDRAAAAALHRAAAVAQSRHLGDDALRLHQAAADAAVRGGQPKRAAEDLAIAVELVNRGAGIIATPPDRQAVDTWLHRATALAGGDPVAEARVAIAAAYRLPDSDPTTVHHATRAVDLAERSNDPATLSVALDRLTETHVAHGALQAAMHTARRRVDLLTLPTAAAAVGL